MTNIKAKGAKVSGEEYIYVSAMTRTRQIKRLDYTALMRLAEAKDISDFCKILPEYSIDIKYTESGKFDAEETVNCYLANEFEVIGKAMPNGSILDFLKLPYDCHNLKTVLKCFARGKNNCNELFIDLGKISADNVLPSIKSKKLDIFGKNMAKAYTDAERAYAESGDPKLIDSILDDACYADMLDAVGSYRKDFFKKLVEIKIDTTNIMSALRTLRMRDTTGLFESMFISGGSLGAGFFKKALGSDEQSLLISLKSAGYDFTHLGDNPSLTALGRRCEEIYLKYNKKAKDIPYGAEICVSYLIDATYATKMLRMIAAAKQTGLSSSEIKEDIVKF